MVFLSSYEIGYLTVIMCALHIPGIARQEEFGCGGESLHRKPRPSKQLQYSDYNWKTCKINVLKIETKPWCFFQDVDEKLLYDTFSAFGVIVTNPKVVTFPINPITLLCLVHPRRLEIISKQTTNQEFRVHFQVNYLL